MKIALLKSAYSFDIVEEPIPQIRPDEVLVRVAACGVCTSELDMWEGKSGKETFPRSPAHKVRGVMEQVGAKFSGLEPGEPVALWVTGRGYAEYVAAKAEYCFPVGEVPLDTALIEPLMCAVNTIELANVSLGDDVVIIGAGFMGNLVAMLV